MVSIPVQYAVTTALKKAAAVKILLSRAKGKRKDEQEKRSKKGKVLTSVKRFVPRWVLKSRKNTIRARAVVLHLSHAAAF